jgi:hypothetical protein
MRKIRWQRLLLPVVLLCLLLNPHTAVPVSSAARAGAATFVFYENFPPANPRQWNIQKLSDGSRTYLSRGTYNIIRAKPGTMRGWPLAITVPTSVQFNVKLRIVSGSDPYAGISFWDDLANNFVLFAITPDGTAGLFRRDSKGFTSVIYWKQEAAIHKGLGAVNSLSVNLDPASEASGRLLLINGTALGVPCKDSWAKALGKMPPTPTHGFHVGVVAGAFADSKSVHVEVQVASMYDGAKVTSTSSCP